MGIHGNEQHFVPTISKHLSLALRIQPSLKRHLIHNTWPLEHISFAYIKDTGSTLEFLSSRFVYMAVDLIGVKTYTFFTKWILKKSNPKDESSNPNVWPPKEIFGLLLGLTSFIEVAITSSKWEISDQVTKKFGHHNFFKG